MNERDPFGADRLGLLQTFVRIVEAGSLSAAAAQLGTTQPTVSRRLRALEQALGLRLLQRSTHQMRLTDDGRRCHAHARALLDEWDTLQADLRGARERAEGRLRVVVPHAFGQGVLLEPLAAYLRQHPGVDVEWLLHDRHPEFIADGVDCAIQVGALHTPDVVATRLAEVPRIVVAAPALLQGGPPPADAAGLEALPWLALHTFYRDEVALRHADGRLHRFAIRPRFSTDSLYALRGAILAGLGAGIVSSWLVAEDLAAGRLLQLAPAWEAPALPVHLIHPWARFYPARLRLFLQAMRGAMPTLAGMRAPATPSGHGA
ncbi:LysR family transcriptional regulator [Xanthomonas sp. XNM01]|uniref:LysR family transcriptional regulator n=1 Tax=Xanthomonas sp. XNM01 TaxID=2769289 RepID=UPI00177C9F34|nr:LysR family transcriptional regulator [Xanthomonas sp. XNM01]MBD9369701.1 LysR family transcriptional regulator [Xanthomonas sp. XNM01]